MAAKDLMFKIAINDETSDALSKIQSKLSQMGSSINTLQQNLNRIPTEINSWASRMADLKTPDLTKFNEQVLTLGQNMGKVDAFGIQSLTQVLKDIKRLSEDFTSKGLTSNMSNLGQSMDKAVGDMGKATVSSLKEYQDKAVSSFADFKTKLAHALGTEGGLNLFPSNEKWQTVQDAYQKLIRQTTEFYTALDRNMGDLGQLSELKRRISDITNAIADVKKSLRNQDLLVDVKNNSIKSIDDIITKIGELDAKIKSIGTGDMPGLNNLFTQIKGAVDKANEYIQSKLGATGTTQVQANKPNPALEDLYKQRAAVEKELKDAQDKFQAFSNQKQFEDSFLAIGDKLGEAFRVGADKGREYLKQLGIDVNQKTTKIFRDIMKSFPNDKKAVDAIHGIIKGYAWDYIKTSESQFENPIEARKLQLYRENHENYNIDANGKQYPEYRARNYEIQTLTKMVELYEKLLNLENEFRSKNKNNPLMANIPSRDDANKWWSFVTGRDAAETTERALKTAVSTAQLSKENIDTKIRLAEANNKAAQSQQKLNEAQSKNPTIKQQNLFDQSQVEQQANMMVQPFKTAQTAINRIIEEIQESAGKIREVFTLDVSGSTLAKNLNELKDTLQPLSDSLKQMNTVAQNTAQAMAIAKSADSILKQAQNGGTIVDAEGKEKEAGKGNKELQNYVKNIGTLDNALIRLNKTYAAAADSRAKIAAGGGDTRNVDAFLERISIVRKILQDSRADTNLLSQSGTMMFSNAEALLTKIKELAGADAVSMKDLKQAISDLGNATPTGTLFKTVNGEVNNYKEQAREYVTAVKEVTKANNELSTMKSAIGESERLSNANGIGISNLRKLYQEITLLEKNMASSPNAKETFADYLGASYDALIKKIKTAIDLQNSAINAREKLNNRLDPIEQYVSSAQATFDRAQGLGVSGQAMDNLDSAIQKMSKLRDDITNLSGDDYLNKTRIQSMLDGYIQLRNTILNAASSVATLANKQEALNKSIDKTNEAAAKKAAQEQMSSWSSATENLARYDQKLKEAKDKLQEIQDTNARRGTNIDTSAIERYIGYLNDIIAKLHEINHNNVIGTPEFGKTKGGELYNSVVAPFEKNELVAGQNAIKNASQQVQEAQKKEAQEIREANQAKREAERAARQMADAENGVARAMQNASAAGGKHSQVLSDLKSLSAQYLSVWGGQQFLQDMVNITGELELQERSLEVILGNASAAREMYSQIRDLSQMSPYSFEDLLKSHRQLAAFGVETNKIFGTLKSLSDIGAGLDVDVSRLILAYGHTKSYGYLSGIQNRQFETAGIDLVGALTDHYNKLAEAEKRAGNQAQFVTRADIFKRMRARDIPFSDVEQVVMGLDQPGGKFYDMQIKQYDTIGGKLRNMRNNIQIMESEMGQAHHGLLSGTLDTLNELTGNWQRYIRILWGVAAAYGTMKLSALLAGRQVLAGNKAIMRTAFQQNRAAASAAYLNGNMGYWRAMGAGSAWSNWRQQGATYTGGLGTARNIVANKELNNITKQRIAMSEKLSETQRYYILRMTGVDAANARTLARMKGFPRVLKQMQLGFMSVAQSAKAMFVAIATDPMTWIMAAVAGITMLANKSSDMSDKAKTLGNDLGNAAKTNIEGIKQTLEQYQDIYSDQGHVSSQFLKDGGFATLQYIDLDKAQLEGRNLTVMFEDLRKSLEAQSPIYDKDFFNIMKAKDQVGQIKEELNTLKRLQYVNQVVDMSKGDIQGALDNGHFKLTQPWTWGRGEDFETNVKDYEDAYQNLKNSLTIDDTTWSKLTREQQQNINRYMKALGTTRKEAAMAYLVNTHDSNAAGRMGAGVGLLNDVFNTEKDVKANTADVKRLGSAIADTIMHAFVDAKGNLDTQAASEYFGQIVNQIMTDAKVGTPDVIAKLSDNVLAATITALRGAGKNKEADQFEATSFEQIVGAQITSMLGNKITKATPRVQAQKIAAETTQEVINAMLAKSSEFKKWWSKIANTAQSADVRQHWKIVGSNMIDHILNAAAWQLRMKKYGVAINFDTDVDYSDFIDKLRKAYKTADEKIKSLSKNRLKWALNIDVVPNLDFTNTKQIKAFRNLIFAQSKIVAQSNKALVKKYGTLNMAKYSAADRAKADENNQKLEFDKYIMGTINNELLPNARALEGEHLQFTDPNKDKKTKNKKTGNKRDTFADGIRNELRALNDVYEEYKKQFERYGNDEAIKKVNELFFQPGSLLKKQGFSFNDVSDYVKSLEKLRQKILDHYGAKNANKAKSTDIFVEIQKAIHETQLTEADKQMKEWASKETFYLDNLTKKWDMYKRVREATGRDNVARRLAGLDDTSFTQQADDLKRHIAQQVSDFKLKDSKGDFVGISFEDILGMDDEKIEDKVKNLLGTTANKNQINALVADLKKWKDLEINVRESSVDTYAKLLVSANTYADAIAKVNNEYDQQIEAINKLRKLHPENTAQYDAQAAKALANKNLGTFEAGASYMQFMGSVNNMTKSSATKIRDQYLKLLKKDFDAGGMSAKNYAEKIKKVNEQFDKISNGTSNISAFLTSGIDGLISNISKNGQDIATKAADDYEAAKAKGDQKGMDAASSMIEKGKNMQMAAGQAASTVAVIDKVVNGINKNVQSLKQILDDLADAMDYMGGGNGDSGDKLRNSGFYGFMSGFSKASQGAADGWNSLKSGDILGAAGGVMRSFTGWFTGIGQWRDQKLSRKIEKIQRDVSKIEGYQQTISKNQERTLGYDLGKNTQSYLSKYQSNDYIEYVKKHGSFWHNLGNALKGAIPGLILGDLGTAVTGATITTANTIADKKGYRAVKKNTEGAAGLAMEDYYKELFGDGSVNSYQQQLNLLEKSRKDYIDMYNKEDKKKKKSQTTLDEYKNKIAELDDQIKYFSEDLAKNLWDIDIKGWADQIGDALMTAFENGDDAAEAFNNTVTSILQGMVKKMLIMGTIEPMFENMRTALFGDSATGQKGVFDASAIGTSRQDAMVKNVISTVSEYLGDNSAIAKSVPVLKEIFDNIEALVNKDGNTLLNNNSSSASSSIKGITEQTADILASYLNAIRADVSVIRQIQGLFYQTAWPEYVKLVTNQYTVLQRIDNNVQAIRTLMDSNGLLFQRIDQLANDVHRSTNEANPLIVKIK